jgi:hypothetical protein
MDRRLATQPQDLGPGTETSCAALRTARSWGPRGNILATLFTAPPPKKKKKRLALLAGLYLNTKCCVVLFAPWPHP